MQQNNGTLSVLTLKRLAGDLKLLKKEPLEYIDTYPDEQNILLWWFVVKGPEDSPYRGGYFIGQIQHNKDYPIKPPELIMITPNGRFAVDLKICLTNSSYHPESWTAAWNMRLFLIGFLSIMMDNTSTGIAHLSDCDSVKARPIFAKKSIEFNMANYKHIWTKFSRFVDEHGNIKTSDAITLSKQPNVEKAFIQGVSEDNKKETPDATQNKVIENIPEKEQVADEKPKTIVPEEKEQVADEKPKAIKKIKAKTEAKIPEKTEEQEAEEKPKAIKKIKAKTEAKIPEKEEEKTLKTVKKTVVKTIKKID